MSRITVANLRAEINEVNEALEKSGSNYRYKYDSRNSAHCIDLTADGKIVRFFNGYETPRILIERLNEDFEQYLGKTSK